MWPGRPRLLGPVLHCALRTAQVLSGELTQPTKQLSLPSGTGERRDEKSLYSGLAQAQVTGSHHLAAPSNPPGQMGSSLGRLSPKPGPLAPPDLSSLERRGALQGHCQVPVPSARDVRQLE